jgi:hypothetical protein
MSTQPSAKRLATQATDKPVKRTRVSRACDQCRIAREKCDGAQPTCSTCSTSRRACTYTAAIKKRGIQPGYIRALELALAYLFQHDPENETLINDKLAQGGTSSLLLGRDSKDSNKLHRRWRKARFYTEVDRLLSGGEPARHDPSSSDSDEDPSNREGTSSAGGVTSQQQRQDRDIVSTVPESAALYELNTSGPRVSIPQNSWRLLETYFTYACWFPVSEKHDLLKLSYSYPAEGFASSQSLLDAGIHAELWSVLAVASVHDTNDTPSATHQVSPATTSAQMYATARSLVPEELGRFDLNHVKALLNLAIFNIARSAMEAAWLLIAYASRIIQSLDQALLANNPRFKHTFYGCFILDSMLAVHFDRRPYLRPQDVKRLRKIEENGLDEWQPWDVRFGLPSDQRLRTPVLALSTFNAMVDILDLLVDDEGPKQDKLERLKAWELSLPSKLAHICATTPLMSPTPTTILLQLTYRCTALALTSSQTWLLRSLSLLEQAQDEPGWKTLPPVLRCLLEFVMRRSAGVSSSHEVQRRLDSLKNSMKTAWSSICEPITEVTSAIRERSINGAHTATLLSGTQPVHRPLTAGNTHAMPLPHNRALPEAEALPIPNPHIDVLGNDLLPTQLNTQYPEFPSDLESFFDELASLDTASNLDTQPKFMQNLGFAPDASIADLFSEYIPIQSSAFASQVAPDAVDLDHYGFFDGG